MTQAPAPIGGGGGLEPHRGSLILVFGILSWLLCFIFGIVAWVMGNADLQKMDAGLMDPEGRGMTQAGKLIGMIHIIVSIVAIVFMLIFVFAFGGLAMLNAAQGGGGAGP
jgi:hypothetical protein